MSGRQRLRGMSTSPSAMPGILPPRNSILSPTDLPLERSKLFQALIDVIAVVFGIIFVCSLAASLPLAVFIMLFANF